jgi:glycerophosphoryl diester phosphodiesterase
LLAEYLLQVMVEMDVRLTSDRNRVAIHDETLKRTTFEPRILENIKSIQNALPISLVAS